MFETGVRSYSILFLAFLAMVPRNPSGFTSKRNSKFSLILRYLRYIYICPKKKHETHWLDKFKIIWYLTVFIMKPTAV